MQKIYNYKEKNHEYTRINFLHAYPFIKQKIKCHIYKRLLYNSQQKNLKVFLYCTKIILIQIYVVM